MGTNKKITEAGGLGLRESCRRMVEEWLNRDLRRLMQLSFSFSDEWSMTTNPDRSGLRIDRTLLK